MPVLKRIGTRIVKFVCFGVVMVALATGSGFLGGMHWFVDLFSHFRIQYAVLLALATVVLLVARRWGWLLVTLGLLAVNGWLVATLFLGGAPVGLPTASEEAAGMQRLKVFSYNLNSQNQRLGEVAAAIRAADPDLVVLQEYTPSAREHLADALRGFEARVEETRHGPFGMAVFSRVPFAEEIVRRDGDWADYPSIEVRLAEGNLRVMNLHPPPPVGGWRSDTRDFFLAEAADRIASLDGPWLVAGDLNASPWSSPMRGLIRTTGLVRSMRGAGLSMTWPAPTKSVLLRTIIDHVLVSPGIRVVEREVGPDLGSDHLPLLVEVAVPLVANGVF